MRAASYPCAMKRALTSALSSRALAAILLAAAAPAACAWTRISCDLQGKVANAPLEMRQYRTDGSAIARLLFRLRVNEAVIPQGERADTDCTEFVNREIDVALENASLRAIRRGQPLRLRYRYDESRGEALATQFELEDPKPARAPAAAR